MSDFIIFVTYFKKVAVFKIIIYYKQGIKVLGAFMKFAKESGFRF